VFNGAGHLFEQFTVFLCGFMLRACVFRVSSSLGFSGGGDCCEQFTVFCVLSCWGLVFLGFQAL
jgi:hypothetical protein